jgi:hypothetical protein
MNIEHTFNKFSIIKVYLVLTFTLFFFSYLLVPNPEPTKQIQGQYYGEYIWPVGVMMHKSFGETGWTLFSYSMSVWFIYAFPVFLVGQSILQIPIPFSPTPYISELPWPNVLQWGVLFFIVIYYNYLLVKMLPYGLKVLVLFAKGAKHAQIGNPDEKNIDKKGRLVGQETDI